MAEYKMFLECGSGFRPFSWGSSCLHRNDEGYHSDTQGSWVDMSLSQEINRQQITDASPTLHFSIHFSIRERRM